MAVRTKHLQFISECVEQMQAGGWKAAEYRFRLHYTHWLECQRELEEFNLPELEELFGVEFEVTAEGQSEVIISE